MLVGLIIIEGIVLSFCYLITLVIGISNGPIGMVVMYEKDVQDRVIEKGLITKKKMNKIFVATSLALYIPTLVFVPIMVYFINGARGFLDIFWQSSIVALIANLFDRLFIDWYWVGKTKAWDIPGTEDLKPYIPTKTLIGKWIGTIILTPLMAAISALIFMWF